ELARVRAEPLEARGAPLDVEVVGDDGPVAVPDGGVVVALPLVRSRDLHAPHLGLEHLGKGAVDQTFEPLRELLQDSHGAPPPSLPSCVLPRAPCRAPLTWYCLLIVSTRRPIGWFPLIRPVDGCRRLTKFPPGLPFELLRPARRPRARRFCHGS